MAVRVVMGASAEPADAEEARRSASFCTRARSRSRLLRVPSATVAVAAQAVREGSAVQEGRQGAAARDSADRAQVAQVVAAAAVVPEVREVVGAVAPASAFFAAARRL